MPGCDVIRCSDIQGTNCYCDDRAKDLLMKRILETGTPPGGIRFFGSGNYHYVSSLTTALIQKPYTLVMIDHHGDMRAPAFAGLLSCGGWVRDVLKKQPLCCKVLLVGVDEQLFSEEIQALREEDERLANRVIFIPKGAEGAYLSLEDQLPKDLPVFLSIDLDVLSEEVVQTDWDQGDMSLETLLEILRRVGELRPLIGVDIVGDAPA